MKVGGVVGCVRWSADSVTFEPRLQECVCSVAPVAAADCGAKLSQFVLVLRFYEEEGQGVGIRARTKFMGILGLGEGRAYC